MRDDDEETINPNVLTGQDLLEMAKIKVKQGESKRNNKWNKEQSATPPAPPKPAPPRRTTKTAVKLEEACNNQHNCTDHNDARKMTSGSTSLNINGIIGCNCALKGINVLEKHGDKAIDNVDNAWTPMPRPLVIDSGAAETVIPSDWFANHKVEESAGSRSGVYYTTADGTPVHNEGEKTLTMCTPDGQHLRQMTFQVAAVNKALGSVSKIVNNGNRVVFDMDGSYIENKWSNDRLWLREDNGVYVLDMLVAPNNVNHNESIFGRPGTRS